MSETVFVIGATGGVGRHLCPRLVKRGHRVRGLHRDPAQAAELEAMGVEPVLGDIMTLEAKALETAMAGASVVVFSAGAAGSGLDRTRRIDGEGPLMTMTAMKSLGIDRLLLVSAFPEAGRDAVPKAGFEHYMRVKKETDAAVVGSGLDWVILRPGTLLHEEGDGLVSLGWALPYGNVARGSVAETLAELVERPHVRKELIELTDGSIPVADAFAAIER